MVYNPSEIEPKWQKHWEENQIFKTAEDTTKPKYYALDMFPYPSAAGLHVGHPLGYTATDIVARYYRMNGHNVLHPMGWDAFGLPAEQHAIDTGEPPAQVTHKCIENFKRQLKRLGFSYDWNREIATCDPSYYQWTQKIFTLLYEKGLAYQAEVFVNWCPGLKTVLANEEVTDGKSERGGHPVYRVPMKQWMLKITAYAERLLNDLDKLDWPESTKEIQRHWIGRSQGAKIRFQLEGHQEHNLDVFTTRPDTLFGVTYMVIAPEHPLVHKLTTDNQRSLVTDYQEKTAQKSDLDRTELNKEKSGVFTGSYAIHPIHQGKIPIWISDYVMMGYGTGAIMAVPAHDNRDWEFAKKFGLLIKPVIKPLDDSFDFSQQAYTGQGLLMDSDFLNGLDILSAQEKIISILEAKQMGQKSINYKLRDWVFSRQRYWGEPIPILKDSSGHVIRALQDDELPLTLPKVSSYEPTGDGKSPLSAIKEWVQRINDKGEIEFIETDTMPGSAASSWYFLRYVDPFNTSEIASIEKLKYWMPVDLYVGGQEHAVGHLLYSRFWTKVLFDAGLCPVDEPFQKLVHQGLVCRFGAKMSKSKGNGISPDEVVAQYGADTLRVYEMFMGPLTQTKEWDDSNLAGVHRFLSRIERFFLDEAGNSLLTDENPSKLALKALHKTIKKITDDIENLSFNTSIAQMMIFLNTMGEQSCKSRDVMEKFLILLSPFAPHLAEHLWNKCILNEATNPEKTDYPFVSLHPWPQYEQSYLADDEVTIGVQVNGKHRGQITISVDASQQEAMDAALLNPTVVAAMQEKNVKKVIYVSNKILNFVIA